VELRRYLRLIWRRKLLVVVTLIAGLTGGYFATSHTPSYRSQATIYVGIQGLSLYQGGLNADLQTGQQLIAETFAQIIPTATVASQAILHTHVNRSVNEVVGATQAKVLPLTNLISLSVGDRDPHISQILTQGMTDAFISVAKVIDPLTTTPPVNGRSTSEPIAPASIFQPADYPTSPQASGLIRNLGLGGAFGILVAVGLVLLLDYVDVTAKGPDDLERRLDLPVLGIVPMVRNPAPDRFLFAPAVANTLVDRDA
jgi:capsular polysaccharide biosynthesis protein